MTEHPAIAPSRFVAALILALVTAAPAAPAAQNPPGGPPAPPTAASPIEKLGKDQLRVGNVRVDTARREVSVAGVVNDVMALEFVACTKGGFKAYESALELDTNAINFNVGLILIGLDKKNAVVPQVHFDQNPPKGDPVEIWVEWHDAGKTRRVGAEELVHLEGTKQTLSSGLWVYTGSTFVPESNAYLADLDGALIGFVRTPSPVIEYAGPFVGQYGAIRLNPQLNLKPGTRVTLGVRAVSRAGLK